MGLLRPNHWQFGKAERRLPLYFPSVSSVKTNLRPIDYVRVLNRVAVGEQYLVSAYDLIRCSQDVRNTLIRELNAMQTAGGVVLMDSGNYESYWRAPHQAWTLEEFHEALRVARPTAAFGFDYQEPPAGQRDHLRQLNAQHEADRAVVADTVIVPIVHGPPQILAQLCPTLVRDQNIDAIAVPERSLGLGVWERVKAIRALRKQLDQTGRYVILHLLGTGNPISLALYVNAGADMGEVNLLRGQAKNEKNDLVFDDYSVKEAFNSKNADYIKSQIREKIDRVSVTVVYLSSNAAKSEWVNWEIEESFRRGKGVIGVYKGAKPPAAVPSAFNANKCKAVKWSHAAITQAINDASDKRK